MSKEKASDGEKHKKDDSETVSDKALGRRFKVDQRYLHKLQNMVFTQQELGGFEVGRCFCA